MAYTLDIWKNRLSERSDLSTSIVHLTRGNGKLNTLDVLFNILNDKKLIGSTTNSGFICGNRPAVCFQDAPLYSIAQNVWFEEKYRKSNNNAKLRYEAAGLAFKKYYAYKKGARPVLYEEIENAKEILKKDQWWRIVNFDLSSSASIIDWTHEREWRCPEEFIFDYYAVTIILEDHRMYKRFIEKCEKNGLKLHKEINGIIVMSEILH